MNVNLHHLELFYYTAKAKGISNAVKIIPYGIRQPAISQQLMKLEEEAGTRLFERADSRGRASLPFPLAFFRQH